MSVLNTMMRMQYQKQQEVPEAINRLGGTLGDILGNRERGSFEQAVSSHFLKNGVTPESVQQIAEMYPQRRQEILQMAGTQASQLKAQKMKDNFKSIQSYAARKKAAGEDFDASELASELKDIDPETLTMLANFQKLHPEVKLTEVDTTKDLYKSIGGKSSLVRSGVPEKKNPTQDVQKFVSADGKTIIPLDMNNPESRAMVQAEGLKPYEKPVQPTDKTPTPSEYVWKNVGKGMKQQMRYNLQTKAHDIPYGAAEPIEKTTEKDSAAENAYKLWAAAKRKRGDKVPDFDVFYETVYNKPNAAQLIFGGGPPKEMTYDPKTGAFK